MTPVSDFSGLTNCACALARAAAKAATDSLERCMGGLFGGRFLGKGPWQHELGFKYGGGLLDNAVEGRDHPKNGGMPDAALDVADAVARVTLVPGAIELFGGGSELDHEITGEVLGLRLAALLAPQPHQSGFIAAHDDPGVGATDESSAIQMVVI